MRTIIQNMKIEYSKVIEITKNTNCNESGSENFI